MDGGDPQAVALKLLNHTTSLPHIPGEILPSVPLQNGKPLGEGIFCFRTSVLRTEASGSSIKPGLVLLLSRALSLYSLLTRSGWAKITQLWPYINACMYMADGFNTMATTIYMLP